jgi:SAM-dependent methyltransferase
MTPCIAHGHRAPRSTTRGHAPLIGADLAPVGLGRAVERALDHRVGCGFVVANATALPLNDACIAGAMSIDSLQYLSDKRAAFEEVARVLVPQARFVFTAFELEPDRVAGLPVLGDPAVDALRLRMILTLEVKPYSRRVFVVALRS